MNLLKNEPIVFLNGQHVALCTMEEDDALGEYPSWLNNQAVCTNNSHARYPYSRSQAANYIKANCVQTDCVILAIRMLEDWCHVGNIALNPINYISRSAELSIIIGAKQFWGKGIGTEAAALIIHHAFFTLNLNRVYFGTPEPNIGMQKIGKRLGMKQEGCRRQAFYRNGKYYNIYEYGLLRDEFLYEKSIVIQQNRKT